MTAVEPIRDLEDIKRIEDFLKRKSFQEYLLFKLGINCGLRISDILSLNVSDVKEKDFIILTEQKTGKFKKIPINSTLKVLITKYTKFKEEDAPLFLRKNNERMNRYLAYRILNNACKKINLDAQIGTHTLRKTFGYHFYKRFKDIAMLQKIFNHTSPYVTLRYIGIEQSQIEKCYEKFIL